MHSLHVTLLSSSLLFFSSLVHSLPLSLSTSSNATLLDTIYAELATLNTTYAAFYNASILNELLPSGGKYAITQKSSNPLTRAAGIDLKRLGFLYGPPVAGGPYYPNGPLGLARDALDQADIQADLNPELANAALDDAKATADIAQVGS